MLTVIAAIINFIITSISLSVIAIVIIEPTA